MRRTGGWLVVMAAVLAMAPVSWGEPVMVEGKVTSVTLYREQALVTRVIALQAAAGPVELVVGNLPEQVVPDSLFAEADAGVEIRAVRFRTRAVGEEPREEVRKIDDEIEALNQELQLNQKKQALNAQLMQYLDKMENFVTPTMSVELAKGVLNAESLEKVTEMVFTRRAAITENSFELTVEAKELGDQVALLARKRAELTAGSTQTVREAVLFLEKRGRGDVEVRLNYLVGSAGWDPAYNFRAPAGGKEMNVEYNALIRQLTGENWDGVKLTLSTGSPTMNAEPPKLAPFDVVLSSQGGRPQSEEQAVQQYKEARRKVKDASALQQNIVQREGQFRANWDMNRYAVEGQYAELSVGKGALRSIERTAEGEASVTYAIGTPVSLSSRADRQLIEVSQMKMPATFYHVAVPILSASVYREAEVTQNGAEVLLGGPVSVYLDGRFVGRAEIPTVSRGQVFVVGFGADAQLRCSRELVDRTERQQGGNRAASFEYRLTLENYGDAAAKVRLMDRIPHPPTGVDIRVTLSEMKEKLSEDPVYLRLQRPKGIMRWDVNVPGKAFGEKPLTLSYGFTLEYDRNLALITPGEGAAPRAVEEFQKMLDSLEKR